mgnify:CR=1 FL=1
MWYETAQTTENDFVLQLGPIVISAGVLLISIFGSLTVFPINLLVVQLFRKSKPKNLSQEDQSNQNDQKRKLVSKRAKLLAFLKQKYWFPYYVTYISWALTISANLACCFFVIMYSLDWGEQKANEWLSSLVFSTVQSVFFVQPIKVIFLAAIIALIFKTLDDEEEDEEQEQENKKAMEAQENAEMNSDEDPFRLDPVLTLDRINSALVQVPPTGQDLDQVRLKRDREKRSKALIKEVVIYVVFLFLISYIAWGHNDLNVYRMNDHLYAMFDASDVNDGNSFWSWTENTIIPNLYSMRDYRGDPTTKRERKFTVDGYSYRVGPSRLRQLRIPPEKCKVAIEMAKSTQICNIAYSMFSQEEGTFEPGWLSPNGNYTPQSKLESAFTYQTAFDLAGLPYWGYYTTYSGGGYIADMGITEGQAMSMMNQLKDSIWLDIYTRMIALEFTTYNPNVNLFSYILYTIEFPPIGGATPFPKVSSIQIYSGVGGDGALLLGAEIVYIFFMIYFIGAMVMQVKANGAKAYLAQPWNVCEVVIIIASIIALAMYIIKELLLATILDDLNANPEEYTNYMLLAEYMNIWNYVLGIIVFLATIKFLRILRFNKHIDELASTMKFLKIEIFQFSDRKSVV